MSKIGLFYASSTGNTEDIASLIKNKISATEVELHNVAECTDDAMEQYDFIIIGASTWGEGDLQDDWEDFLPNISKTNFSSKTVALFGLGDQEEYCDNYLDAMGTLYDEVIKQGATVVGSWSTDGYEHDESNAIRDGEFVGLALDEDNQGELSNERVSAWIEQITPYF
ncbi:flavodoxin [Sulfurimonas sp.]|uniref:flavodoxin n=1 Tax=Sulfurimonas sp. TaxID=2022749 RepID=UPI002AAFCB6E|nr:flavodoxin [Sulfurimonas sp.]